MSTTIEFPVSSTAFSTIEGSEIYYDAVKYDGGSDGAREALAALRDCRVVKAGAFNSYRVTTGKPGAECIEDYCRTVGETFASETEADIRREGRALLKVADRIDTELKKAGLR